MSSPIGQNWILLVCTAALASSCSPQSKPAAAPAPAPAPPPRHDSSLAGKVFQEVNSYRRSHGAPELQRHTGLDRLAQEHSEYLLRHRGTYQSGRKSISHVGFQSRVSIARERYRMLSVSENVAASMLSAKDPAPTLVRMWSNSKTHDVNMRDNWTHTGIGVVKDNDGMVFSTQLFTTASLSKLAVSQQSSGS